MKELERQIKTARSNFDKAMKRLEFLLELKAASTADIVLNARNVGFYHAYYSGIRDACNRILDDKFRMREGKLEPLVLRAELECAGKSILDAERWMSQEYGMMFEPEKNKRGKITGYKASFYKVTSLRQKI